MNTDSYPLALAGVEENIGLFMEVNNGIDILSSLRGSYDKTSVSELGNLISPEVKKGFANIREHVMKQLNEAIGFKKAALG